MGMTNLELRCLTPSDEDMLLSAVSEFSQSKSDFEFAFHYYASIPFHEYVELVNGWAEGKNMPERFVPNTYLVGIVSSKIVGRISLRHQLNEYLLNFGGHIGYGVVPSERNRGYATMMLKAALPVASKLGIDKVLVTCDEDNFASQRVIEKCDGHFENSIKETRTNKYKMRYWIDSCRM